MKYAFFPGCKIPYFLEQYERSTRSVLAVLDVELCDVEFNCCGYPARNLNFESFLLSAARNMALAEQRDLDILTPCKCCFGSLRYANHGLRESADLRREINRTLGQEGLAWNGETRVKHLLSVLDEDVGVETIRSRVQNGLGNLHVAAHYGCHALRPGNVVRFDNPLHPTIFERLVQATGARSVEWPSRLECCGHPLWEKKSPLSLSLMRRKLYDAGQSGADCICTACTYCQLQFDTIRVEHPTGDNGEILLPSLLYPQLLGLSFGLPEEDLGIGRNRTTFTISG